MVSRNDLVKFIIDDFYDSDVGMAAKAVGKTKQHIQWWLDKTHQPHKKNVSQLLYWAIAPQFRVITEFATIRIPSKTRKIHSQLARILKGYEKASGVYAFYDSMANLIYIGKSNGNLLAECYQRINAAMPAGVMPKGIPPIKKQVQVVRYLSAYCVPPSDHDDYALHVETLILRISKPKLNTNLGKLAKATPATE